MATKAKPKKQTKTVVVTVEIIVEVDKHVKTENLTVENIDKVRLYQGMDKVPAMYKHHMTVKADSTEE